MDKQMKYLIGLMAMSLMLVFPGIIHADPGARVLITDNPGHRVIEIDPVTKNVVWSYGTGVPGSGPGQLNYPNEAIPLTNGNIMIADTYNGRVIEVGSATKNIVWEYPGYQSSFRPVDIKRCKDYSQGTDTLLTIDGSVGNRRIVEVTYPGRVLVWDFSASSIGGTGDYIFWEVEKRPGSGTPTYLITCRSNTGKDSVIEVQRTGQNTGIVTWQYGGDPQKPLLNDPRDANWVAPKTALITDTDNKRVLAVDYWDGRGKIVWQWGPYTEGDLGTFTPYEAIRIENGGLLIAGAFGDVDDNKDGKYQMANLTSILEVGLDRAITWRHKKYEGSTFVDVEEKGIINLAQIEYNEQEMFELLPVFAGVVVPIYQPEIVAPPTIVATKTVSPQGPQKPGATLTYTINLTNIGPGSATNVMVTDRIPEGTVYIPGSTWAKDFSTEVTKLWSHDGGLTYDNNEFTIPVTHVRWIIPEMPAGESGSVGFSVQIE